MWAIFSLQILGECMRAGLRFGYAVVVASLAIWISAAGTQASTVVTWDSSARLIDGVATQHVFDVAEIYFSEFTANSLTSITGAGTWGNYTKPNRVLAMSVRLDGVWTEIYNSGPVPASSALLLLSTLDTPMLFDLGVVSGLKLTTLGDVNYAFHSMLGTKFTFDLVATPLPAALPLVGGGLGFMGLAIWWRRRSGARTC
jgi:hypothetical protein